MKIEARGFGFQVAEEKFKILVELSSSPGV